MFNTLHNVDDRKNAWVFTCDRWAEHGSYILLPINPANISIQNQLRTQVDESKRGKIVYIARNQKNKSLFKPPEIQFTIPSGNIFPMFSDEYIEAAYRYSTHPKAKVNDSRQALDNPTVNMSNYSASKPSKVSDMRDRIQGTQMSSVQVQSGMNVPDLYNKVTPVGIQNLYAFMMLADEQRFHNDVPNKVHVHINSLLYPSLFLRCTFTEDGISWTESSEDPGQFDLEFSLRVLGTSPQIGYGYLDSFFSLYASALSDAQSTNSIDRMRKTMGQTGKAVELENVEGLRGRVKRTLSATSIADNQQRFANRLFT
jgi:hypothetical protein